MGAAFGHADPPGEGKLFTTIRAFTRGYSLNVR
jgi:hypothetical protein